MNTALQQIRSTLVWAADYVKGPDYIGGLEGLPESHPLRVSVAAVDELLARASAATQAEPAFVDEHGRHYDEQAELVLPPVALPALTDDGKGPTKHDWPEDWPGDNGMYLHRCAKCSEQFIAHKRRYVCKVCSILAASAAPAPEQMQPNAQDKAHRALPLADSVCGVNAAAGVDTSDRYQQSNGPAMVREALRTITAGLPRHKFWGAGEPDCPPELKAPNGELHTMRCKVCGDGWRKSRYVCLAAHVVIQADLARRLLERLEYPGPSWAENRAGLAKELRVASGVSASDGKTDRAALSAVPPTVKE